MLYPLSYEARGCRKRGRKLLPRALHPPYFGADSIQARFYGLDKPPIS